MKIIKRQNYKRYRVKLRGYFYREYIVSASNEENAKKDALWRFEHDPDNPCNSRNTDRNWFKIEEVPNDY